jgi:hypothetical protein
MYRSMVRFSKEASRAISASKSLSWTARKTFLSKGRSITRSCMLRTLDKGTYTDDNESVAVFQVSSRF